MLTVFIGRRVLIDTTRRVCLGALETAQMMRHLTTTIDWYVEISIRVDVCVARGRHSCGRACGRRRRIETS